MKKLLLPIALAIVAGAFVPIQTGANTSLSVGLGDVGLSTFVVFMVASLATLTFLVFQKPRIPSTEVLKGIPWYAWLSGGVLGSGYIYLLIFTAPKLGMTNVLGLVVLGKIFTAIAIDHFGWLGMTVEKVNWQKIIGAVIMIVGIILIKQF